MSVERLDKVLSVVEDLDAVIAVSENVSGYLNVACPRTPGRRRTLEPTYVRTLADASAPQPRR